MTALAAIFAVMGCIFVGEWVSKITHAYLPSVFVSAMLVIGRFSPRTYQLRHRLI